MSQYINYFTTFIRQLGRDPDEAYPDSYGESSARANSSHIVDPTLSSRLFTYDYDGDYRPEMYFDARSLSHFADDFTDSMDFS